MVSRFAWPPLISVVAPDFSISMAEAGSYMTGFYIGYVVTQIPSGMLADRFGVRILLSLTLLVQAVATYLLGEIDHFSTGFALRIISGLSGGCVYAACFRLLVQWFPVRERGTAFGLLMSAPSLGLALANAFVPVMEDSWGWRSVFNIIGAFALVSSIIVFALIREAPDNSMAPSEAASSKSFVAGIKYVLGNRNILLLCGVGFSFIWAYVGFISWGNTFMKEELGVNLQEAGRIMSGMAIAGLIASLVIGTYAGKSGKGRQCLVAANIALIVGILAFGQITGTNALWFFALFIGAACGVMNAVGSLVVSMYSDREWAGAVGGVTNCFWQFAGALVPVATGWAIDASGGAFEIVWLILAAGPVICIALILFLTKP